MWLPVSGCSLRPGRSQDRNIDELQSRPRRSLSHERHVTEEQRVELRKFADEIVERLTARAASDSDDEVKKKTGRNFGIVWSQFNKHFNTTDHGLPSLPRERFDDAKGWLLQYPS